MNKTVRTEKELSSAINSGESRIMVGGNLGNAVLRIGFIAPIYWRILIAAIKAVVSGISDADVNLPTAVAASGGADVAKVLERIAVSGGIHTLHTLRKYKAKREGSHVVLTRH